MKIDLPKKGTIDQMGSDLKDFDWTEDKMRWSGFFFTIDLTEYTQAQLEKLKKILTKHITLPRVRSRLADLEQWLEILSGKKVRCKKIGLFAPMLKQYLKQAPKHWVYERRAESDVYQPYYVSIVTLHPKEVHEWGGVTPAHVIMSLWYEELGKFQSTSETFWADDVEGMMVAQALGGKGYAVETPKLLANYEAHKKRYVAIHDKIGMQFNGTGPAEPEEKDKDYWWKRKENIRLEKDGEPSKLVIDLLTEGDEKSSKGDKTPSADFWKKESCDHEGDEDDNDNDIEAGDEDEDQDREETAQVPLMPALMCFDLKRHMRLKVYVDQLADYVYDTSMADKLILPPEVRELVDMLVAHKGGFQDIVGKKGGGAVILCAGRPGTGKTLTSEVYSEAMKRPLYSVQCSQLGLKPDDLEEELLKVFARAFRWNAILLLDEADVYVAARGSDLQQNAIVGVFLRVLEYYQGVLFMTTNRADLVDDAIASRCLARIDYNIPTPKDQKKIWKVLAGTSGLQIKEADLDKIVKAYPELSGRDVKNLLKLVSLVSTASGKPIDAEMVGYVKQFKPTNDDASEQPGRVVQRPLVRIHKEDEED